MSKKLTPYTPEQIEILKKQRFSGTEPGTLLKDLEDSTHKCNRRQ
ncbi:MAG: hypothetical protein Q8L79_18295 [Methylobacter sp.]|nr:hypothetical protein [Methylobacter sp.]MDP1667059.1 hypothetical protein [Methylobacter sp.]MDP1970527.1 hypothetical protein [Methylobacter sp.]